MAGLNENHDDGSSSFGLSNTNKFDTKLFAKLHKDSENLEFYYKQLIKRFRACCLCMSYLFEPLNEPTLIRIRSGEIVQFLKRIFLFDYKNLVNHRSPHLKDTLILKKVYI